MTVTTADDSGADSMLARDNSGGAGGPYSGDNALGGGNGMQIRSGSGAATGRNRLGIVRFDISALPEIVSGGASIEFNKTGSNSGDITVYGLNDLDAGENWDEPTITYNTAPGISFNDSAAPDLSTDFDLARMANLGTFSVAAGPSTGTFSGAALDAFIANDTNGLLSFYLYNGLDRDIVLTTKEGGAAPALTLQVVPEPASALILAMLGLSLAAIRRRG